MELGRRRFLGLLGGTVLGAVAGVRVPSSSASTHMVSAFQALRPHEGATLIAVVRRIVPHRQPVLQEVAVETALTLDARMVADFQFKERVRQGLADLNVRARDLVGEDFIWLTEDQQVTILNQVERTPFFQELINRTLTDFYNRRSVWEAIGYPGPTMNVNGRFHGGYLHRGFDRLDW